MNKIKIVVDAGHGLHTAGKRTPDGEREWSFNNKVVRAIIFALNEYVNVEVLRVDDPTGESDVPLRERTRMANAFKGDAYVSVHHNANTGAYGTWTGTETFVMNPMSSNPKSLALAKAVHPHLVDSMGLRDRGIKSANFHVLREARMPAILTEAGYMDSSIDVKVLRDDKALKAQGEAIAKGLAEHFNLVKKVSTTPKEVKHVKETRYTDVGKSHSAYNALERLSELDIINGYADGSFKPNEPLTRSHMAIIVDRLITHLKG